MLSRLVCAVIIFVFVLAGCQEQPKAPPLVNDTVYQNNTIGLRFLAPEGWSVVSRAELPSSLPKPVILISNFGLGLDYILMALAPTLWWLFAGRIISGICAGSISASYA